jgi:hypothetical protein
MAEQTFYNAGISDIFQKLSTLFLLKSGVTIPFDGNLVAPLTWQALISNGDAFYFPVIDGMEVQLGDSPTEEALNRQIHLGTAPYGLKLTFKEGVSKLLQLMRLDGSDYDLILVSGKRILFLYDTNENTAIKGFGVKVNSEQLRLGDASTAMSTSLIFAWSDPNQMKSGNIGTVDLAFDISSLLSTRYAYIKQTGAATATSFTIQILDQYNRTTSIEGFEKEDFLFVKEDGTAQSITTVAQPAPPQNGAYTFTGTGFTSGALGLKKLADQTTKTHVSFEATKITIA